MNRRRFLGLSAALGATAATAAACGVPSTSDPQRVGEAPSSGPTPAAPPQLPGVDDADTPTKLVQNFLKVTAWANINISSSPSEDFNQALARARSYLVPRIANWQPAQLVTVGRARVTQARQEATTGQTFVDVQWTPLGKLTDGGAIEPDQQAPQLLTYAVVSFGTGYRLGQVPLPVLGLLLSDEGLGDFYEPRQIYFWDQSDAPNPLLVPDMRYLPSSIAKPKQPNEIIDWLTGGPADWMRQAAQAPPAIDVKDEPSIDNQNRLVINLSSKAANLDKTALRQLAIQLRWSIDPAHEVALRIEGTPAELSTDDFASFNLAARNDDTEQPERYYVLDHKIRGMNSFSSAAILDSMENAEVVSAAMLLGKDAIALVRHEGKNPVRQRLWIGSRAGPSDRNGPVYLPTNVVGDRISRPSWLRRPSTQAIVACDGRLFTVPVPTGTGQTEILATALGPLPAGVPAAITAVSVSPDGHRLAFVAGGRVVVVPLAAGSQVDLGPGFVIVKTEIVAPRAVGWSNSSRLIVGGPPAAGERTGLAAVGIDGVRHEWVPGSGEGRNLTVDQVSVHPSSATRTQLEGLVMFEANAAGYTVYTTEVLPILVDGPAPSPTGTPPQSPSAPFFLD
jgi:hypothetical protein